MLCALRALRPARFAAGRQWKATLQLRSAASPPVMGDGGNAAEKPAERLAHLSLQASKKAVPLPKPNERNVLVTSALPYVNNVPHLGNLIGAVLSADVYARYLRQRGTNCVYICGTDEYGTATETKAQQEGLTPRELCDKYFALHKDVYDWFDISFDYFGRTSTEKQTEICQEIFWTAYNNGFVTEDTLEQLFCVKDQLFLADRYVTGTCPHCGYEDTQADQCDNCQKLLNPNELIAPKCAICSQTPEIRTTNHLFLNLPKLQGALESYVEETSKKGKWPHNALVMTYGWLKNGLEQRCITRDLKWGTPVPLENYTDKVFYVWFDAPIGYISITANCTEQWREWWYNCKENVDLVQFMGKDNVPFHTVVFPSTLLATREKWTMMHHISTTEYLNYEDGKFSKRNGVGVFGPDAKQTDIPPEVWRYYLLSQRPESGDTEFQWSDFAAKNNDELLKNLGNLCNRALSFRQRYFKNVTPMVHLNDEDQLFVVRVNTELKEYIKAMDAVSLKAGVKLAMSISKMGNAYMQSSEPWELIKTDRERAGSVIALSLNLVFLLAKLMEPFFGHAWSSKMFSMLGVAHSSESSRIPDTFILELDEGVEGGKVDLLFRELPTTEIETLRARFAGNQKERLQREQQEQAFKTKAFLLDLRIGRLTSVEEHPESEFLFMCRVDVGEDTGPRDLVAGLRGIYTRDELLGRQVIVVCNLVPARLAGTESRAMLLSAEKKKEVKLLEVANGEVGQRVYPDGVPVNVEYTQLDRKGFQHASKSLRVGTNGAIVFEKQHELKTQDDVVVTSGGVAEGGKIK